MAAAAVDGTDAHLVKVVGDAVMLAAVTRAGAIAAVAGLFEATYQYDGFPEPRAGLHQGPVIERDGDYFGATVDLAAAWPVAPAPAKPSPPPASSKPPAPPGSTRSTWASPPGRDRRRSDDLLTPLAQATADGQVTRPELVSLLMILLLAGHETTTGALGNAVVALARHPGQRDLVRRRPELWPNAVEELLRFDPVVQTDPRAVFEEVTIGDRTIKKGQNLTVMLGAVNRDPRPVRGARRAPPRPTGSSPVVLRPRPAPLHRRRPRPHRDEDRLACPRRRTRRLRQRRRGPRVEEVDRVPRPEPTSHPPWLT